jgi:predicted metal-binding protein
MMRRIGIIVCDRYRSCAGGKCFRALRERVGGFREYGDEEVEVVGFTTCGGCPGGNIEYAPAEMAKNGVDVIHLATGMVVGYPPCPYIEHFKQFIEEQYEIPVIVGTHPIPEKYYRVHRKLSFWKGLKHVEPLLENEEIREAYD